MRRRRLPRIVAGAGAFLLAGLVLTLAVPLEQWRSGDQGLVPLDALPAAPPPAFARRLWIDTDAACGVSPRTDPDDCLAIALLAKAHGFEVIGVSTVFGNAPAEDVNRTAHALAARLGAESSRRWRVHEGASSPSTANASPTPAPAHEALVQALAHGPLTIVALGPLTNVARVLREYPELRSRVAALVAVMGRRPGHLFHPAEGASAGSFLGHGPVFRDFNFAMDEESAARVLAMRLPLVLVPYDAARTFEMTKGDLDRVEAQGGARAWVARRSRAWLQYWRDEMGREGFFPFDVLAALFVAQPDTLGCASMPARVDEDRSLFFPLWRPTALLVGAEPHRSEDSPPPARVLYCGQRRHGAKEALMTRLAGL